MSWQRINIENSPQFEELVPVQIFFNSIPESNFVRSVNNLTKQLDESIEGITGCHFPRGLDEFDVYNNLGFDGVQFTFYEDIVVVDNLIFRKYLRMACEVYWQEHPETKAQLEEYLARPQPLLEEGTIEEWKRRKAAGEFPKPYSEFE